MRFQLFSALLPFLISLSLSRVAPLDFVKHPPPQRRMFSWQLWSGVFWQRFPLSCTRCPARLSTWICFFFPCLIHRTRLFVLQMCPHRWGMSSSGKEAKGFWGGLVRMVPLTSPSPPTVESAWTSAKHTPSAHVHPEKDRVFSYGWAEIDRNWSYSVGQLVTFKVKMVY